MNLDSLPQTTDEALELVWPDIGSPMETCWTDDQRLFAKRLAGACRLLETFGPLYEQWAAGNVESKNVISLLALAAWRER